MNINRPLVRLAIFLCLGMVSGLEPNGPAQAADGHQSLGGIQPRTWILGARAGFAVPTQSLSHDVVGIAGFDRGSAMIGPLVNVQALYSLNRWFLLGLMVEWERHDVDVEDRRLSLDVGSQHTVSVLPTLELRPVTLGSFVPYVNMSFGVNVNSFSEGISTEISPSNTFAWRLGWGVDYLISRHLALNAEWAYKRNDGHAHVNDRFRINDWNLSSFGFLFGVRAFF
ncbi:MAG: porin family protein [Nitrospira sp.]|nr:porin family protein [Nitrospira sp.]MCP9464865.1 porin family protein [Nitrospira sp.]